MNLLKKAIKINFNISIIWSHVKLKVTNCLIKMSRHHGLYVWKLPNANSLYKHLTSDHEEQTPKNTRGLRSIPACLTLINMPMQ